MTGEWSAIPASSWPLVPVWSLLESREEFGDDLPLLSVSAVHGVRWRPEGEGRAASDDTSGYRVAKPGDLVVNRLSARDGAYAVSRIEGLVSPAYWVLRPRSGDVVDERWIDCVLRSAPYGAELRRISKYMPPAQFDLPWDMFRRLLFPLPPLPVQRAIADYLDRETARIDALIEKKGKLVSLLQSRVETVVENHVRQLVEEYGSTPLKHAVRRVEVGIVITPSVWYGDEGGVPALRGLNVQPGRIDVTDLVYLTEEGHEVHRKSVLRQGDVVVVRTGQAGAAAVVPSELDGCNCIDLVIVRPSPELVPQFLEYVLNSDWTQKHVEEYSVGTIQSHFNVGAMKQVPIPLPPLGRQSEEVEKLGTERAAIEELKECLTRQIDLLTEHRQALITAAVTGELEIPGVAA